MIEPGEIYWYDDPVSSPHPVVVLSREELNRGDRVTVAVITSSRLAVRSRLANCVAIQAGQFGMTKDCVVQGESVFNPEIAYMDVDGGAMGRLDDPTFREVIKAIGYVMDSDCEPC